MARVQSSAAGLIEFDEFDPSWNVVEYMLQGSAAINGRSVSQFETVRFDRGQGAVGSGL